MVLLALALVSCVCGTRDAQASAPVLTTLGPSTPTGAGPAAAFSPDGRWLATANETAHTVTLFSVSAGGVLTRITELDAVQGPVKTAGPFALAFDEDGELLAVANARLDTVSMFKVSPAGLERVGPLAGETSGWSPQSVAFSPVRRLVATADHNGNSVSVFSVANNGTLSPKVSSPVSGASGVAFNADGLLAVVSHAPHTVDVYRVGEDRRLIALDTEIAPAGTQAAAFDPTGTLLATANQTAGSVSVYHVTAAGVLTLRDQRAIGARPFSVAFGPGGLLATANQDGSSVSVFSVSPNGDILGQAVTTTTAAIPRSVSFAPGPHAPYLAVATRSNNAVSVFSAAPNGRLITIGSPAVTDPSPGSVAFHPSGTWLATANKFADSISMIHTPTGEVLQPIEPRKTGVNPLSVAFSADGKFLATANHASGATGTVSVFPVLGTGVLGPPREGATGGNPYSVAFQPLGDLLATANKAANGMSLFRIAEDGTPTRIKEREATGAGPVSVAFSRDGERLATANQDAGTVSVFRVLPTDTLELVRRDVPTGAAPASVAFSRDGNQLATANTTGGSVSVFDVLANGDLTNRRDTQLAGGLAPTAVAFSPTTPLLATANLGGNSMSLYRVADDGTLTQLGDPSPTGSSPQSAAFSPDGTLVATPNSLDATVSVFTLKAPVLEVWITQTPADDTNQTTATFAFRANYPATFECRLDAGPFTPLCASPVTYAAISQGAHTFTVRATDPAQSKQATGSAGWRIDLTPPIAPSLIRPIGGTRNLPSSPQFAWAPTTDAQNGIARYELLIGDQIVATVLPEACTTECSATPRAKLGDGTHSWTVRAVDGVGNAIAAAPASIHVDGQPPAPAVLTSPLGNAATAARRPPLSWQPASDGDGVGVKSHEVWVDDTLVKTLDAPATTFTPEADLPDGTHRWKVVARDRYDNAAESAVGTFTVDTSPPVPVVDGAPNPVREDRGVTFDASRSTDIGSGIARYEWDLAGDGAFERDTGATPSTTHTYPDPRDYVVRLRVTDRAGNSAVGQVVERVTAGPPPPQVVINAGDRFTNSTRVTLDVTWPMPAREMLVSNDRRFASAQRLQVQKRLRWTLARSGGDTRTVFVRFIGGLTNRTTYSDSITLDQRKPVLIAARLATENGVPVLRIKADDQGKAGVGFVQFTNDRNDPKAQFRLFSNTVKLTARPRERPLKLSRTVYVRVRDRAGNLSGWGIARRAGRSR